MTDQDIDLIANDGYRNAAGGIYETSVYEFARAIEKESRRAALEEAAKICDLHSTDYNRRRRTSDNPTYMEGKSDGAEACASALYRALAEGDKQ